jgi:hypothetical protein
VRNVPLQFTEVSSLGSSSSAILPHGVGGSGKFVDEGDLQYVAFKVDRLHLAQIKCLEVPGGSLKKPGRTKVVSGAHSNGVRCTTQVYGGPDQGA